jgi:asparagine synthase (glutamine-hydrolysing)
MHGYSVGHSIARMMNMMASDWLRNFMKRRMGKPDKNPAWLDIGQLNAKPVDPHIALNGYTDSIQSLSCSQLTKSHLQALLHWEDRDSMAYGIESRVPYLDHHLVEFTLGLPDEYKLSGGITKKVLRDSLSGIIPDKIRDRTDKLGFVTPEEVWVRETGTDLFRYKITQAIDSLDGIIKPQAIEFFDEIVSGKKHFNFAIWRILNFAEWVDVFDVELPPANVI